MASPSITKYGLHESFGLQLSRGQLRGHSIVHKFGRNDAVGTSFVPVSDGGIYQTPTAANATTLRIKAGGDAADASGGNGAREVTLIGLDANGNEISEAIATNGISASSATSQSFMRLYRAYVSASGTYATAAAGSHTAAITIENGAGGTDWASIDATGFPKGQTEIAAYSVPAGYDGYVTSYKVSVDSSKTTDLILFQRANILESAAPYTAMRALRVFSLTAAAAPVNFEYPIKITGPADVGWMAKVSATTSAVSVNFEIVLVER